MRKFFFILIVTGLFFYSCGSAEQTQHDTGDSQTAEEQVSEDGAPSWYNHANRTYQDSTEFAGTGMAIAGDSLVAVKKSTEQAQKYLNYAIDSYAEDVRRKLIDGNSASELDSANFVLSLRQAVKNLQFAGNDLKIETKHTTVDGSVHLVYSRVSLNRDRAIDRLAAAVDHDLFSLSIREES
ncbi:hypothetical protein [Rhodohalobacter sp. 8-1]|uniref:hypothetical protein n=1 Tax=Rhodohalobacter sp. 8-1 TaxID=3131972 RepID=UPI0030EB4D6C